jgi:hypothetical protein
MKSGSDSSDASCSLNEGGCGPVALIFVCKSIEEQAIIFCLDCMQAGASGALVLNLWSDRNYDSRGWSLPGDQSMSQPKILIIRKRPGCPGLIFG